MARCPFNVLGLPKSANKCQVKAQYKQLAKEHHPDTGGSEAKFKEVHEAYESCNKIIDENEIFDKSERGKTKPRESNVNGEDYQQYANSSSSSSAEATGTNYSNSHYERKYTYSAEGRDPDSDDCRTDPNSAYTDRERRRKLCDLFDQAATADEVDTILSHCLTSRIFDSIDIGEPLLRALGRFHCVGVPLGESHVSRCVSAIESWEHWHAKKAPQSYYHNLMFIYCDASATHDCAAIDVCQGVSSLLEYIEAKGFIPDDMMMSLASRVFRTSPLPDW